MWTRVANSKSKPQTRARLSPPPQGRTSRHLCPAWWASAAPYLWKDIEAQVVKNWAFLSLTLSASQPGSMCGSVITLCLCLAGDRGLLVCRLENGALAMEKESRLLLYQEMEPDLDNLSCSERLTHAHFTSKPYSSACQHNVHLQFGAHVLGYHKYQASRSIFSLSIVTYCSALFPSCS